jgi:membrane protease subunit (stomatin/prohibitin family)
MFFRKQFANVVEWQEFRDDMIFYKWKNDEIKKGSRLIIRPGQDVIFLKNGKIEGIFHDEGDYDIESQIIPFLSTLKGFKFGFNSGMRVEVLFVNTKEFVVKWGTPNVINIPAQGFPGGMPVRANGTFTFKVKDYVAFIDQIAGVRDQFLVEDVRIRISAVLDQLLMKWITREGRDMFNLQANAAEIGRGIREDLDMEMMKSGITITGFTVMSFNYPKEVQDMINKIASQGMVGDIGRYQQIAMTEGMASGKMAGGGAAADMASMMMGMQIAGKMLEQMNQPQAAQPQWAPQQAAQPHPAPSGGAVKPNFCPNCGTKTGGGNFCSNCWHKLV